jgi:hypothetical protein
MIKALTHMVDLLLEDTNIQTVLSEGKKDEATLKGYISEVLRKFDLFFSKPWTYAKKLIRDPTSCSRRLS